MNKIKKQHFRVDNFEGLAPFYVDLLGMQVYDKDKTSMTVGFDQHGCGLVFHQKPVRAYQQQANDFYWKIGITLRDLDTAVDYLRKQGQAVADPYQFRDIGYMSKITDPKGFTIELLQQGFEGQAQAAPPGHPVGAQAILAHITLRVTELQPVRDFLEHQHGMRLMSIQPVSEFDFCLYFYGFSDETLPNPDLTAIDNRSWLWRRPCTFIELQHLESAQARLHFTALDMVGFDGISYTQQDGAMPVFLSSHELENLT